MLGIAVGCIGMSYDGFCALEPEEFTSIYKAYGARETQLYREDWERVRILGYMCVQPYAKKGLTPRKLLSFPWDNRPEGETERAKAETLSKEEALEMFKKRMSLA